MATLTKEQIEAYNKRVEELKKIVAKHNKCTGEEVEIVHINEGEDNND